MSEELSYTELRHRLMLAEAEIRALHAGQVDRTVQIKRMLLAIRNVNQLIIHETDARRLIERACANLIENLSCHGAWVALLDEAGAVTCTASAGLHDAFPSLQQRLVRGEFPTCMRRAIERDELIVISDVLSTCPDCILSRAYAGSAGLSCRLAHDNRPIGILAVSVPPSYADDTEMHGLLRELAGDLAFGLRKINIEQALHESERQKSLILNSTSEMIAYYDTDLRVVWANSASGKPVGRSAQELVGLHCYEIWQRRDSPCVDCPVIKARDTKTAQEAEMQTPDGRQWLVRGYPLLNDAGAVIGIAEFGLDITERKRAEAMLQHRQEQLAILNQVGQALAETLELERVYRIAYEHVAALVDCTGFGISLYNPATRTLRAEYVLENGRPLEVRLFPPLNIPADSPRRGRAGALITCRPEIVRDLEAARKAASEEGTPGINIGDDRQPLSALYIPMVVHGQATGLLEVQSYRLDVYTEEDVALLASIANQIGLAIQNARLYQRVQHELAERKQAEEARQALQAQLAQAQKMDSIGRLAGGIAHDFNNMLSVILGHAEIALSEISPSHPLAIHLEEIRAAGQRSANLTRQLLAFARKQTITPKTLDLNQTIEGMLNMLRRLIGEDIELVWQPGAHLWPVKMDPSQIDQTLANLCVNARDAIAGVGTISIETHNISIDEMYSAKHIHSPPGDYVLLAVSDTGCGMGKDVLDKLFEPFFTTKEVGQGVGLGLATVYGIVRQNNGFINVYSEPGQGATFKIYLPRATETPAQTQMKEREDAPTPGHETILLVEDDLSVLEITARHLKRQGYRVLTAAAPDEAIRLAKDHAGSIDLLITDVIMPKMNGRELADRLSALSPKLKCLYMSGYTANVIAHRGILEENVHFIEKPFSGQDLVAKVREFLKTNE